LQALYLEPLLKRIARGWKRRLRAETVSGPARRFTSLLAEPFRQN
jgi:hypothetical protein